MSKTNQKIQEQRNALETKLALLFYYSEPILRLWDDILHEKYQEYIDQESASLLLDTFLSKSESLKKPVFIASPSRPEFIQRLSSNLKDTFFLDFEHEIYLIEKIFKENDTIDHIAFFDSVFPLWDMKIFHEMLTNHTQHSADHSYGENLPPGVSPVLFSRSFIEALLIENEQIFEKRNFPEIGLSSYIEKNINDFHIEIHYEEPDLRMWRLDFSTKNVRSFVKTQRVYENLSNKNITYNGLEKLIHQKPHLLYSLPSYLEVEIISNCEYKCIFCPRQYTEIPGHSLDDKSFQKIIQFLSESFGDTSLTLGGMGEPLQHSKSLSWMKKLLDEKNLRALLLETNGFYLNKTLELAEHPGFKKMKTVINLNGFKNYAKMHGVDASYLSIVKENLDTFIDKIKKVDKELLLNVYIQILKMNETEDSIDEVYDFCQKKEIGFLLQKYNRYINLMPERRVSDMTPLERSACWHLRRDMFIRANGDVSFCKQDVKNENTVGNLKDLSLKEIWKRSKKNWTAHVQKQYSKKPDCLSCDEYFTFNL